MPQSMWYVVQTVGGQEKHALKLMRKLVDAELLQESFIPQYEVMKKIHGQWEKRREILLPGYLFVVTDDPAALQRALWAVPAFTRLLRAGDAFEPLSDEDISFIDAFTTPDERIIGMSEGVIEGDQVIIINGPLMNRVGSIVRIDRHKRLAFLRMDVMGREKTLKVGLEIVRKH